MASKQLNPLSTQSGLPIQFIYGTAWKKERTTELVIKAVLAGFRAIDTACQPKHYSEDLVGQALATLQQQHGIQRGDVFIQTKFTSLDGQDPQRVPYDVDAPLQEQCSQSLAKSLSNLRTDYIDSLVLHGPMRTTEQNRLVWSTFETFYRQGKVKRLGVSNFYDLRALQTLYDGAEVKPSIVQNRFYADTGYDVAVRKFCGEHGIVYQSFWTLTANPHILRHPTFASMANARGATAAQLFFRYVIDIGITPLTGTTSERHMREDLAVLEMPPLSMEEITQINQLLHGG